MPKITRRNALVWAALLAATTARAATVQFFGDVYVPEKVLAATESTAEDPQLFDDAQDLLGASAHNVVNLEGVATRGFQAAEFKQFLLRMPVATARLLKTAGIDIVTLANNHSFDYGYQGLAEMTEALAKAGVAYTGAGINQAQAVHPVIIPVGDRTLCLLAFSRTFPADFWATESRPGTAFADVEAVKHEVGACAASGRYTVVAFHWGREMTKQAQSYQRELAHQAINAGAQLVLGHHPHVVQELEIYKGRPIAYSLGNFAFGTSPTSGQPEGLALRVAPPPAGEDGAGDVDLIPLQVFNSQVHFRPRPIVAGEADPLAEVMPKTHPCAWSDDLRQWHCKFTAPEVLGPPAPRATVTSSRTEVDPPATIRI